MEIIIKDILICFLIIIVLCKAIAIFKHYFDDNFRLVSASLEFALSVSLLCHFFIENNISVDVNELSTITKQTSLLLIITFVLLTVINGFICIIDYTKELNNNDNLDETNSNIILTNFFKKIFKRFVNILPSCVILFSSDIIFNYLNKIINIVEKANNSQFIYCLLTIIICYFPTIIIKTLFNKIINLEEKGEKAE